MLEYERVNLKLSDQQIKKIREAVKSNNGTTLRIGNKNFNKVDLLHELFLTQTQINKLREKAEHNMSTDIKLSKAQLANKRRRCFSINTSKVFTKINKTGYFIEKKHFSTSWIKCSHVSY